MNTNTHVTQAVQPAECIIIYADGACSGNPGLGGFAAILHRFKDGREVDKVTVTGDDEETTNSRMEMMAVIAALAEIDEDETLPIIVRSDSQIVVKGMTEWLPRWVIRGWKGSDKKPVKNKDLWQKLMLLAQARNVSFEWVRGHGVDERNEEVDGMAEARAQRRRRLARPVTSRPRQAGRSNLAGQK